jgi:hypothetical protein
MWWNEEYSLCMSFVQFSITWSYFHHISRTDCIIHVHFFVHWDANRFGWDYHQLREGCNIVLPLSVHSSMSVWQQMVVKFMKLLTWHSTTITHSKYLEFSYCIKKEYWKMNARHCEINSFFFFASSITVFENYF